MSSSQDHVQQLIQKLVFYSVLYQTCSDNVRHLGLNKVNIIYDEAYKEWQSDPSNPLFEPPLADKKKRAGYLARCDEICRLEPNTVHE